jgi:hypothetical protein
MRRTAWNASMDQKRASPGRSGEGACGPSWTRRAGPFTIGAAITTATAATSCLGTSPTDTPRSNCGASVRDRHREWGFTLLPPSIGPVAIDPGTVEGPKDRTNLITRKPEWLASHYDALDFPYGPETQPGRKSLCAKQLR